MRVAFLALLLTGCATTPPDMLANCAAYQLQLEAAAKAVNNGTLNGAAAAAEKARLEALPERAMCLDGIY
jgi:starvation-inducible outer membrane lipoprotein